MEEGMAVRLLAGAAADAAAAAAGRQAGLWTCGWVDGWFEYGRVWNGMLGGKEGWEGWIGSVCSVVYDSDWGGERGEGGRVHLLVLV